MRIRADGCLACFVYDKMAQIVTSWQVARRASQAMTLQALCASDQVWDPRGHLFHTSS